jgi:hypothetical protein
MDQPAHSRQIILNDRQDEHNRAASRHGDDGVKLCPLSAIAGSGCRGSFTAALVARVRRRAAGRSVALDMELVAVWRAVAARTIMPPHFQAALRACQTCRSIEEQIR